MSRETEAEWADYIAARNAIETAKARWSQPEFDWTGVSNSDAKPGEEVAE